MFEWITATLAGKILATAAVSAVPVIELRGGIPFSVSRPAYMAFICSKRFRQYAAHTFYTLVFEEDIQLDEVL